MIAIHLWMFFPRMKVVTCGFPLSPLSRNYNYLGVENMF